MLAHNYYGLLVADIDRDGETVKCHSTAMLGRTPNNFPIILGSAASVCCPEEDWSNNATKIVFYQGLNGPIEDH